MQLIGLPPGKTTEKACAQKDGALYGQLKTPVLLKFCLNDHELIAILVYVFLLLFTYDTISLDSD